MGPGARNCRRSDARRAATAGVDARSLPGTKGLAVEDALRMARQIADALEAAHERGIVHRDLKPANIKVTPAGVVKVLDFGIAKITDPIDDDATGAPTMAAGPTREGTAIGTAPYMSPEQARGLAVDTRCDIWAFGCVLYELVAGRPAFGGETGRMPLPPFSRGTPTGPRCRQNCPRGFGSCSDAA